MKSITAEGVVFISFIGGVKSKWKKQGNHSLLVCWGQKNKWNKLGGDTSFFAGGVKSEWKKQPGEVNVFVFL